MKAAAIVALVSDYQLPEPEAMFFGNSFGRRHGSEWPLAVAARGGWISPHPVDRH